MNSRFMKRHSIPPATAAALLAALIQAQAGALPLPQEEAVILTPPAPAVPRINCPNVYGARPGSPFLYRVPVTGAAPITFAVENLPAGLALLALSPGKSPSRVSGAPRSPPGIPTGRTDTISESSSAIRWR